MIGMKQRHIHMKYLRFNYSTISLTPVVPKMKAAVHILKMYVKKMKGKANLRCSMLMKIYC